MVDLQSIIKESISNPVLNEELYDGIMQQRLVEYVEEFLKLNPQLETMSSREKIEFVNNYLKDSSKFKLRKEYFDALKGLVPEIPQSELMYRTGYALLTRGESMCAGYAEATNILLSACGVESEVVLAKILSSDGKEKPFFHFVTIADSKEEKDRYIIVDSEREANCEKKGKSFEDFKENMVLGIPPKKFLENKIGQNGLGESTSFSRKYNCHELDILMTDLSKERDEIDESRI